MFSTSFGIAIINGDVTLLKDAKISLMDRGFLFGHALFETLLYKNNDLIEWNSHYQRLHQGCRKLKLICPGSHDLFAECQRAIDKIKTLIFASNLHTEFSAINERLSVKILMTGGDDPDLISSTALQSKIKPNIYIICRPVPLMALARRMQGYKLKTFLDERGVFSTSVKNTNYLFSFLCLDSAHTDGFDDILFINTNGDYTESATSTFLWFDDKFHIHTTPPTGNCLAGTSILTLETQLIKAGYSFDYRPLNENKISECVGCALISSIRGLIPIKSIDNTVFDIDEYTSFFKCLIEFLKS